MKSHEVDYQVYGDDLQFVEIELDPSETVIAEAGAMMYMEDGIGFETKMGDGSKPEQGFLGKLGSVAKRAVTGESIFMTHFTNNAGPGKKHVAFGAPYPGKIIAIDLDEAHGELICQKDSFLCAALGTEVSIAFNKKLGAGLFGGEGFIL
ncbi:MAG: AIM24 family protein, partial [Anaerolineales bacterium]|nr:AIM24 family protein [Anaerolineales bacterium]